MIVCYTELLIVQIMHASLKVIFLDLWADKWRVAFNIKSVNALMM